jgi:hypothetical protein
MCDLVVQDTTVIIVELRYTINLSWVLRDQSTLFQEQERILKAELISKLLNILEELRFGDASKRVSNPVFVVSTISQLSSKALTLP